MVSCWIKSQNNFLIKQSFYKIGHINLVAMKYYRCEWSFYRMQYNALCFSYDCFEFMMHWSNYLLSLIELCAKGHAYDCTPQKNRSENWLILTLETHGQRAQGRVVLLISSEPLIPLNRNFMTSHTSHWIYFVRF